MCAWAVRASLMIPIGSDKYFSANSKRPRKSIEKRILGVVLIVSLTLSTLTLLPLPFKAQATPWVPLLGGWGGSRLEDTVQNMSAPASLVFPTEKQSNFEQIVIKEQQLGYNAIRGSFAPSCIQVANNFMGVYTTGNLSRAISIAQHFSFWLTVDYHGYNEFQTSASTSCWLSFWLGVVSQFKNSYSKIIWEPLNEPNQTGTGSNDAAWTSNSSAAYQKWINQDRKIGDTHWIVVQNTCSFGCNNDRSLWYLDYPAVNDTQGHVLESLHTYMYYPAFVEHLAYDSNNDGTYDSGDIAIVGGIASGTTLASDPKILFVNATNSPTETWSGGKALVYDSNSNGKYDAGDTPITGTVPAIGTPLKFDSKVKFVDSNIDGVWAGWSNTIADTTARQDYLTMLNETSGQGWPILNTEGGTSCSTVCPYVIPGSAGYSSVSLHYAQDIANYEDNNSPRLGRLFWVAASWTDTPNAGVYGALNTGQWGTLLSYKIFSTPTSGDRTIFESSFQRFNFYARGLYWLFYEDTSLSCEGQVGCLTFTTSIDASNWASPTSVGVHVADSDYSIYSNATAVFYARYNETYFFSSCSHALIFRAGTLSTTGTVSWQSEHTVKSPSATDLYVNTKVIVDSNNQAWVAYLDANAGFCGGTGIDYPHVIHSSGINYAAWSSDTILSTAHSNLWQIDLAALPNGQVYAGYWISTLDMHGKLYNGSWGSDEQVSSSTDRTDVNSFIFNNANNVYAIWYDSGSETIRFGSRSSSGAWTVNSVGTGEATATSINQYSLPITATYNPGSNKFYFFWYNTTGGHIDQWVGSGSSWTATANIVSGLTASNPNGIASFLNFVPVNGVFTLDLVYVTQTSAPFYINSKTVTLSISPSHIITLANDLHSPMSTAPESQQRVFQNTRGTQAMYVFYTTGDTSGTCQYAYSTNGASWTTGQSTTFGSYFTMCSIAYREDPAHNRTLVYAVSSQYSDGVIGFNHNILFNIGTIPDSSSAISWVNTTPQTLFAVSSTDATEYPVVVVDAKGYLLVAFSYLSDQSGTKNDKQNVIVCGSSAKLPTSNPTWTCSSTAISCTVGTNCPFANTNEANSDDAKYMPQLVPNVIGYDAVVTQGHCEGVETVRCHSGQIATQERANTVTWTGTSLSFGTTSSIAPLTLAAPSQDPADQRSVTISISTGTIFFAYANGTSGTAIGSRLIMAKLAPPYTSWSTIQNLELQSNALYLTGVHLTFDQAADSGFAFYNYASPTNGTKVFAFSKTLSTSPITTFYTNATYISRWVSVPMIVDNVTLATNQENFVPLAWVNTPAVPELWSQQYAVPVSKQTGSGL